MHGIWNLPSAKVASAYIASLLQRRRAGGRADGLGHGVEISIWQFLRQELILTILLDNIFHFEVCVNKVINFKHMWVVTDSLLEP